MSKLVAVIANDATWTYNLRREIIEALIKNGYRAAVIVGDGSKTELLKKMGCLHYDIAVEKHGTNPFHELRLISEYKKVLMELRPDIVLTYTLKPNAYAGYLCGKLDIPYVANITGLGSPIEEPGILRTISLFLLKRGLKKAQMVFFQNRADMSFLVGRRVVAGKYDILPGSGVNTEYFSPLPYPDDDTVGFVFISRVIKEKGIDQYLEAAEYIKSRYKNTVFHICGGCDRSYSDIINEMNDKGIIVYHGMLGDIRDILKITHCTIHPTYYPEGMSNVLLESCACARPIITTDRSGCREIAEDGVNGYMIPQKDSGALIAAIEKFLRLTNDERAGMGRAGREKVVREFDRRIVVEKYIEEVNKA